MVRVEVRRAGADERAAVRAFYAAQGYAASIADEDVVVIAIADGAWIGIVRLAREDGVTVLRGMRVVETWQRRGIGTRMLVAVDRALAGAPCYCIPYRHLVGFYAQIGFREIAEAAAPRFLAERVASYRAARADAITLMYRPGSTAENA